MKLLQWVGMLVAFAVFHGDTVTFNLTKPLIKQVIYILPPSSFSLPGPLPLSSSSLSFSSSFPPPTYLLPSLLLFFLPLPFLSHLASHNHMLMPTVSHMLIHAHEFLTLCVQFVRNLLFVDKMEGFWCTCSRVCTTGYGRQYNPPNLWPCLDSVFAACQTMKMVSKFFSTILRHHLTLFPGLGPVQLTVCKLLHTESD